MPLRRFWITNALLLVMAIQPLLAQRLGDEVTLSRFKRYAEMRRKLVTAQQKEVAKDWRKLPTEISGARQELEGIINQRKYLADSQDILLTQLISLGKGQSPWAAGPYPPLSIDSIVGRAVSLKDQEVKTSNARIEAAGKLAYAKFRPVSADEYSLREAQLIQYDRLITFTQHSEETLNHVLGEIGQPTAAVLYEGNIQRQKAYKAKNEAQRKAQEAERKRNVEIGTAIWVTLGALWLAGQVMNEVALSNAIATFERECTKIGGKVIERDDTYSQRRLIECRN